MNFFTQWKRSSKPRVDKFNLSSSSLMTREPLIIDDYPDPIYVMDLEGNIISTNKKFALLFTKEDEFVIPFSELFSKEQFQRIRAFHKRALSGEIVHYEVERSEQEQILHYLVTNIPLYEGALIAGMYGIIKDTTDYKELLDSSYRFQTFYSLSEKLSNVAFIEFNFKSGKHVLSENASRILGITQKKLKQMKTDDFYDMLLNTPSKDLLSSIDYEQTVTFVHPTKGVVSIKIRVSNLEKTNSSLWVLEDLTDQVNLEKALQAEHEKVELLSAVIDTIIVEVDYPRNRFTALTPGFSLMFGETESYFNSQKDFWKRLIVPDDTPQWKLANEKSADNQETSCEYRIYVKGDIKWIQESRSMLNDANGIVTGYRSIIKDITELKDKQEEIRRLAMMDPVTHTPNREAISESIYSLTRRRDPFTILSVSFNRIDDINQTFGFEMGDVWRAETTQLLIKNLPNNAYIGSMFGDDSIIVLPEELCDEEIKQMATTLLRLCDQKISIDSYDIRTRLSIGVSCYPKDGTTVTELIRHAGIAKFRAQKVKVSTIEFYTSNMDIESLRKFELVRDLEGALNKGEFYLVYQPKVDAWTGQIIGAEALMRWSHPTWGNISPAEFIPLTEENEMFIKLTHWLIEEVSSFLKKIDYSVPISLNVSPVYLMKDENVNILLDVMQRFDIPKGKLEIEIPETTILDDEKFVSDMFTRLNQQGISIALDDFGIGYSSLAYLQSYNVQTIKIDRKFVRGLHENRKSQAIVKSITLLSEEFGIDLVVEGVETIEELLFLRDIGCKKIQGFLFSRPLPPNKMIDALSNGFIKPVEETKAKLTAASAYISASITITHLRGEKVDVGQSPILLLQNKNHTVGFYSTIRLPIDETVKLVVLLEDGGEPLPIRVNHLTELANGLYQYEATFTMSISFEKRLSSIEKKAIDALTTNDMQVLLTDK